MAGLFKNICFITHYLEFSEVHVANKNKNFGRCLGPVDFEHNIEYNFIGTNQNFHLLQCSLYHDPSVKFATSPLI